MITSKQKKFWIPLIVFIVSLSCFIFLLGNWSAILFAPFIGWSVGVFGYYNSDTLFDEVGGWFNRDDWK